ncbi:MAG: LLM class F420-dependent oxidoreductase [Thermomicrobiales bacterium]|nr:LLM class F420-dependent oxidoreductase [Thermomicrobiales bacterium]MCO5218968.1 LLM class F420-dependent oxidoreductase [Thermomicrobiales bacterium]MCO5226208.1 LLM class F420-dependent oxidoreductase [Thermomicrobiales bacterium]MCO5228320.1 LLM class F420-dependent oxidoreductase [Thermomicrobiales bacterium]
MSIDFGVFVPQGWRMDLMSIDDPVEQFEAMTRVAREADNGIWDSIWVYDHFHTVPTPTDNTVFESWTISATLARDTKQVNIGQMVNCNGYRQPSLFAKIASTVDVASHGRLYAGFGAGWYEHEWRAYGYGFPETKERMAMFKEATEIIHKMWTEDKPTFEGKYYTIDAPINEPKSHKPGYKIPLWIGGGGPQVTLKLVALYGDACNIGGDVAAEKLEILKGHCDKVGRNYDEITKSSSMTVYPIATGADPVQATEAVRKLYGDISFEDFKYFGTPMEPAQIVERIQKMQADGIDYVINYIPGLAYDSEPMQRYQEEVIPAFR